MVVFFLIEDDNLLEKFNNIWDKVVLILRKNLITNLFTIENFGK